MGICKGLASFWHFWVHFDNAHNQLETLHHLK
jgi:hypothetical protein